MTMRQVSSIELPAGQTIRLEPGGFHVMLIDLKHGLKAGDKLSLTLRFERAGTRKVTAEVRGL
jgi:copper(I)-binding protein